jgi:DNA modification methylase
VTDSRDASTGFIISSDSELKSRNQNGRETRKFIEAQATLAKIAGTVGGKQPFPHPFPARMPEEVAREAVLGLTKPGQIVLDPMAGSTTIPYVAHRLGRAGIGRDIDPLSVLLGRSRCANLSGDSVREFCDVVLREAQRAVRGLRTGHRYTTHLDEEDRAFLRYWFPPKATLQLFALSKAICKRSADARALVAASVLSSLVIARQAGCSYALDLSRSRPHKMPSKKPCLPFEIWSKKTDAFVRFFDQTSRDTPFASVSMCIGDARKLDLVDRSVDAIITSPPYVDAVDYLRTSKFSLIFFGCDLQSLRDIRARSIGTQVGLVADTGSKEINELLRAHALDDRRRAILRRYLWDLRCMLAESFRVLRPGGPALFVLGPSILSRRRYDSIDVFSRIANAVGFRMIGSTRRDLNASHRSLPAPNRNRRRDPLHKRMTCEHYVLLEKPKS